MSVSDTALGKVSRNVQAAIANAGYRSVHHFAFDMDIPYATLLAVANGGNTTVATLALIADGLGVTVSDLVRGC